MKDSPVTSAGNQRAAGHGFTLVELLVVISVIVLLLALLVPAIQKSVQVAQAAQCRSRMRQVGLGFMDFMTEHRNTMPGVWFTSGYAGHLPWQRTWLGSEVHAGIPHEGVILPYVSGGEATAEQLYRCPSLKEGVFRSGIGSNGMFDFSMIQVFNGAKMFNLPGTATLTHPVTGQTESRRTPLVVEEDPAHGINGPFVDPGHHSINRLGSWHIGGSGQYAAVDGSVHQVVVGATELGPQMYAWQADTPGGVTTVLSPDHIGASDFGAWNTK